ncbi:MAG: hypothetical protein OIF38_16465 [Cellvibrionaceae bacterium]|nr:hypothetical protein [Cellvibrionaceae bacterium]
MQYLDRQGLQQALQQHHFERAFGNISPLIKAGKVTLYGAGNNCKQATDFIKQLDHPSRGFYYAIVAGKAPISPTLKVSNFYTSNIKLKDEWRLDQSQPLRLEFWQQGPTLGTYLVPGPKLKHPSHLPAKPVLIEHWPAPQRDNNFAIELLAFDTGNSPQLRLRLYQLPEQSPAVGVDYSQLRPRREYFGPIDFQHWYSLRELLSQQPLTSTVQLKQTQARDRARRLPNLHFKVRPEK